MTRREPLWTGTMWECPQLFPLGDRHVLLIAVWALRPPLHSTHHPAYAIGDFDGRKFTPATEALLDPGSLYAPQTMRDAHGRRLLWGWHRETCPVEAQVAAGWSGAMSIPWVLSPGAGDSLDIAPVPELEALRGAHGRLAGIALDDRAEPLAGLSGDCLELDAEFDPGSAARLGLTIRHAPGDAEYTRVAYEAATGRLAIERERSTLDGSVDRATRPTALALAPGEPLRLRVFLDRSIVEVFANGRVALSDRIYPARPDSLGLTAFAEGGRAALRRLDCWQMGTIWPE